MKSVIECIFERSAIRNFSSKKVDLEVIEEILEAANRAPSSFNIQPWHVVHVTDQEIKQQISRYAFDQNQPQAAAGIFVIVANPNSWKEEYPFVIQESTRLGIFSERYAAKISKDINNFFWIGPFGLIGPFKRIFLTIRRFFNPTPKVVCSFEDSSNYAISQTFLFAATLMIAARSKGIDTCPMGGFDEWRIKNLLKIPKEMSIPMIIPYGYALDESERRRSIRIPIEKKTHINRW